MKKNKMIIAVIFTFALLTAVFAMSGGGNNDPAKEAQQIKQDTQNDQALQPDQIKSNDTVKDRLGVDTGMTKEEYEKFKDEYLAYQKKCGIYATDNLYYHKTNLNAISEFANHNINLNRLYESCTANDFAIRSEIVAVVSFVDFSIEENKELTYPITLNVKVHEVLMNNTEYEKIPDTLIVKGTNFPNWHFDEVESGLTKMYENKDDKYVLFLSRYNFYYFSESHKEGRRKEIVDDTCFEPFTFAFVGYQRKIEDNEIIFDETKYPPITISLDQFRKNVKEINRINDIDNFYKRSYK